MELGSIGLCKSYRSRGAGHGRCVLIFKEDTTEERGKSQDISFPLEDVTRRKGEIRMLQSPSWQIPLGERGKESGWYSPLLGDTTGKRGETQVIVDPSRAIPLEKSGESHGGAF